MDNEYIALTENFFTDIIANCSIRFMARLTVFLVETLNYDGTLNVKSYKEIAKVLRTCPRTAKKFITEAIDLGLVLQNGRRFRINQDYIWRGSDKVVPIKQL